MEIPAVQLLRQVKGIQARLPDVYQPFFVFFILNIKFHFLVYTLELNISLLL